MSRRKAIASKRRKAGLNHPLADALRELRDAPWPAPGSYKDACGLSVGDVVNLRLSEGEATATSVRTAIDEWRFGRWASKVVVPIRLTGGAGTP